MLLTCTHALTCQLRSILITSQMVCKYGRVCYLLSAICAKDVQCQIEKFCGMQGGEGVIALYTSGLSKLQVVICYPTSTGKICNRSHFPVAVAMARLSNAFKATCTAAQTCCSRCHYNNECRKGGSLLWLAFGLRLTVGAGQRGRPHLHMLLLTIILPQSALHSRPGLLQPLS